MPAHRADGRAARAIAAVLALGALVLGALAPAASAVAAVPAETVAATKVAIVVPVIAPTRVAGLIPAEELAELTAAGGALTRTLDAVVGERVTLAIDPLIAASINALGADAPADAVAWARRLDQLPHERFLLLTADADPTLLRQAGEALPALGTVWTTPGTVSPTDVEAFAAAGASRILLADADLLDHEDESIALAAAGGVGLRVIDTEASAALQAAVQTPSSASLGALRQAIAGDATRESIVVGLDRTGAGWPGLETVLDSLHSDLGLELVGLSGLSGETVDTELAEGGQPASRLDAYRQLVAAEQADSAFASIMADAEDFRDERRLRSFALAAVGWSADPAGWTVAVDDAVEASRTLRAGVRIEESDSLFLADRSSIPISIVNDLDRPVTVVVTARASDGRLDVDRTPVTVDIPAASRATVSFAATAVSNGTVAVSARLSAVDGTVIGPPAIARINVQAGWETPIAAAAAGALLLIVVIGIIRTVRRVRRARAAGAPAATGPAEAHEAPDPGPADE